MIQNIISSTYFTPHSGTVQDLGKKCFKDMTHSFRVQFRYMTIPKMVFGKITELGIPELTLKNGSKTLRI